MLARVKYVLAFGFVAVLCGVGAVRGGGFGLVLLWPAVSFGWVAVGYAGQWPGVFGKSGNGAVGAFRRLVTLPYRCLLGGAWYLQGWTSGEAARHRITEHLWLGRYPSELPGEVDIVVDFTCEFGRPGCVGEREYYCIPTLDARPPPREAFEELVDELSRSEATIYAHCASGHGRSSLFVAAILVRRGLADDVAEAEGMIRERRPGIGWSGSQRRLLVEMFGE